VLPVVFATAFAPAGDAAPELWLSSPEGWLASRSPGGSRRAGAGGGCHQLAGALAPTGSPGRASPRATAALAMVRSTTPSLVDAPFAAASEPLLVALVLGAGPPPSGRRDQAFALAVAAALLRPSPGRS
jgi:hypothetical protein